MFNICELVDLYRNDGYSDDEIDDMIHCDIAEHAHIFNDDFENDPIVQEGWHQQDIIDMYRYER